MKRERTHRLVWYLDFGIRKWGELEKKKKKIQTTKFSLHDLLRNVKITQKKDLFAGNQFLLNAFRQRKCSQC